MFWGGIFVGGMVYHLSRICAGECRHRECVVLYLVVHYPDLGMIFLKERLARYQWGGIRGILVGNTYDYLVGVTHEVKGVWH
jgi:hypothetical protein